MRGVPWMEVRGDALAGFGLAPWAARRRLMREVLLGDSFSHLVLDVLMSEEIR